MNNPQKTEAKTNIEYWGKHPPFPNWVYGDLRREVEFWDSFIYILDNI